ncbi:NINE protein [Ferrimonas sediminicola]|uniref:NINE protein n=1 Tax=Ferrimonas sediminicola TaxID=2569538 RepID=A0A4U1BCI7_9GAMM|nr:NINE protein [Ferrimonas sediminicola]TKB48414.1 NINE protein [Ferrimonas sediminicola]
MKVSCGQCGQRVQLSDVMCSECRAALHLEALAGVDPLLSSKSRRLAAWLSLLLGGLGVHKFYLGQPLKGGLYLAFSWTLVPTALGVMEAMRTFRMNTQQFQFRLRQAAG